MCEQLVCDELALLKSSEYRCESSVKTKISAYMIGIYRRIRRYREMHRRFGQLHQEQGDKLNARRLY
jgi:hypothetical protein